MCRHRTPVIILLAGKEGRTLTGTFWALTGANCYFYTTHIWWETQPPMEWQRWRSQRGKEGPLSAGFQGSPQCHTDQASNPFLQVHRKEPEYTKIPSCVLPLKVETNKNQIKVQSRTSESLIIHKYLLMVSSVLGSKEKRLSCNPGDSSTLREKDKESLTQRTERNDDCTSLRRGERFFGEGSIWTRYA